MKIINKKVSELIPYANNPRKNEKAVDVVASSIKNYGFKVPIIIDSNNEIVTGHARYYAVKKLGWKEVPCIIADDLTPAQIKAFRLVDNKTSEYAEWDIEKLNIELEELPELEEFGFEMPEIQLNEYDDEKEDEIPEEAPPVCEKGDLWKLGDHLLLCGDATSKQDIAKLMGDEKADISFTSPPYNVGKISLTEHASDKAKKTKYNNKDDNKTNEEYIKLLEHSTLNALEHAKYSFVNLQFLSNNKIALIEFLYKMRMIFSEIIIWDKMFAQPAMAENVLNSRFEFIFCFSKKAKRNIGTKKFRGTLDNIIQIQRQTKNEFSKMHNATFPVELPLYFAENFTQQNGIIIDVFGGTGSTLIACEKTGRKARLMELDEHYCDVIIKRWEDYTGEKAEKL